MGYFSRFVCTDLSCCQLLIYSDKIVLCLLAQGGYLCHGKIYVLFLGRKGESRESFLYLVFLKYLQHRIMNIPKWHILECRVLTLQYHKDHLVQPLFYRWRIKSGHRYSPSLHVIQHHKDAMIKNNLRTIVR